MSGSGAPDPALTTGGDLEFSETELLAEAAYEEPLWACGVRCHGGFIGGEYVSPRTLGRWPAIRAWQRRLREDGDPLVHVPQDYIPPHYPNVEQSALLLREGVRRPVVRTLTTISIVEGFGAMIRELRLPDLHKVFKEDIGGTALAHLRSGLIEAHARDEAGHRNQGGHKQMWETARDLALDKPEIPEDVLLRMMQRGSRPKRTPLFPELPDRVEEMITFLANVMVIEIFADDVFSWGERLLGDPEFSAKPEEASNMVRYIRTDEAPHVEYLRTALSEMRARTFLTRDAGELPGSEVLDRILDRQLRGMASTRPREQREEVRAEIRRDLGDAPSAPDLIRRFEDLDAGWTFPKAEDEKLELILS